MIKRIYMDTSVIGGVFDDEFSHHSKLLFSEFKKGLYIPVVSEVTLIELEGAPPEVRAHLKSYEDLIAHIVNLNKIVLYNAVNMKNGYPTIEIRNPRELIHE